MPSFKSCFASLAVMAFTLAPLISAKAAIHDAGLVTRNGHVAHAARAVSSSHVDLDKRHTSAAKRIALRKAAAAKKAAAKAAKKAKAVSHGATTSSYAPGSAFMTSALVASAARHRCSLAINCNNVPRTPNSEPFCVAKRCTYRCDEGFAPQTDGTCAPEPNTCPADPGVQCPTVEGGYTTCDPTEGCVANCFAGQGDTLHMNSANDYACINLDSDVNNCGFAGNVCPASYNGVGSSKCTVQNGSAACTLSCPVGQHPQSDSSTAEPLFCGP